MRINVGGIYTLNSQRASALYNTTALKNDFTKTAELSKLFDADSPAVKLAISEDGKVNYRNSLLENLENNENVMGSRERLIPEKNMPRNYSFELGSRFTYIGGNQTMAEKASDLFRAYAEVYDEIVQGYKTGQREIYVDDSEAESGYRKLTMSEEIDALNAAYKGYADGLEWFAGRREKDAAILEDIAESCARLFGEQDARVIEAKDAASRLKNEIVPENLSERLIKASTAFVQQYENQKNAIIENILKTIMEN